jgi:hypothetical protein
MLRHADAQVASKYRSFLTFIRCELTLMLNPAVALDRARALAQKNMLSLEPLKRPTTAGAAAAPPRYVVSGTLARTKSFVSELYRAHGHERDDDAPPQPLASNAAVPRAAATAPAAQVRLVATRIVQLAFVCHCCSIVACRLVSLLVGGENFAPIRFFVVACFCVGCLSFGCPSTHRQQYQSTQLVQLQRHILF